MARLSKVKKKGKRLKFRLLEIIYIANKSHPYNHIVHHRMSFAIV